MTIHRTVLLLALLLATGCGSPAPKHPLHGKWVIVEATGIAAEINKGTTYEFKANGTMVVSKGISAEHPYTIEGDTVRWNMGERFKFHARFVINGDTMNFEMGTSNQKYVMKRQ